MDFLNFRKKKQDMVSDKIFMVNIVVPEKTVQGPVVQSKRHRSLKFTSSDTQIC